jgi:DNA-binding protein HU-beta
MAKLTKSQFITAVLEMAGITSSKKDINTIIQAVAKVVARQLKSTGEVTIPGIVKLKAVKKPATKARQGVNPFTKQVQTFAAKPASKKVRATAVKALKDAVG